MKTTTIALATALLAALLTCAGALPARASGAATDGEVAGEILVKLRSSDALAPVLGRYALTLVSRFGARPIYKLQVSGKTRVKDMLKLMALDTDIMIAEANPMARSPEARKNMPWAIGNATAYAAQWAPQSMRLPQAQQRANGDGVRVAVLDTGVDAGHPLLAGRLLPGFDFVDFDTDPSEVGSGVNAGFGHGTHVAGLVALAAPGARIMPLRVLDAEGVGNAWVLAEALLHAIDPDGNPETDDGAQVVNISLGSLTRTRIIDTIAQIATCAPAVPDDAIGDRSDPGYSDDEVRCLHTRGAVILAAAGNDGSDAVKEYPAAEGAYGLVALAASSASQGLAKFSNSGKWIDLAAPGEGITSAAPGGGWATWSGTSMAAPLASGVAALLVSAEPGIAPKDVARRLKRSGTLLCGTHIVQVDALAVLDDTRTDTSSCR